MVIQARTVLTLAEKVQTNSQQQPYVSEFPCCNIKWCSPVELCQWLESIEMTRSALNQTRLDIENEKVPLSGSLV